jgi:ubiquinone/menaquinone biosynthesis C-methylase UbiE
MPDSCRKAAVYDLAAILTYALGFRDRAYRQRAVDALQLSPGDTVVEIGCATGLNFRMIEEAIGPGGTLIAVDMSEGMLARARWRASRHSWSNVEFVRSPAAEYEFPTRVDGILSTSALVMVPEYDGVAERCCLALGDRKRCVVLDQRVPSGPASVLVPLRNLVTRATTRLAIGQSCEYSRTVRERRLWESIREHSGNIWVEDFYFGLVYVAVGEKRVQPHTDARV